MPDVGIIKSELEHLITTAVDGSIYTSTHMFGRAIKDKFPLCIFENFEISKFSEMTRVIYAQNHRNQTCVSLETLCIETNTF